MRQTSLASTVGLLASLALAAVPAPAAPDTTGIVASAPAARAETSYRSEFDAVWKAVRDKFYDEKTNGLDWVSVGETYRARLSTVTNDTGFARLINDMLARLNASHTRLFTPDDFEYYLLPAIEGERNRAPRRRLRHIGILAHTDQRAVVAAVLDDSPAERAGLRPGDVLLSLNGEVYRGLSQFGSYPVTLTYRRGERTFSVRVTPVEESPATALLRATLKSVEILRLPDGRRVGYIRLWCMADRRFAAALETAVCGRLHDTEGLILDLRGGFGGTPSGFADVFYRPDIQVWSRGHNQQGTARAEGYAKPLVVLTDEGTRSAKEWMAWTLQKSGRATLVGHRTAGAVLAATGFPITDRFYLSLAVLDLKLNGERLEGRGVTPDVIVAGTPGEDALLEKAIAVLTTKLPPLRRELAAAPEL